jgi:hypothetical protein
MPRFLFGVRSQLKTKHFHRKLIRDISILIAIPAEIKAAYSHFDA